MENFEMDEIQFNCKSKKNKSKKILEELDAVTNSDDDIYLPISFSKPKEKKEKKKESKQKQIDEVESAEDDDWLSSMISFSAPKPRKKGKRSFNSIDIDIDGNGKKKKKKDKGKKEINYKKEFEPEVALLRHLQLEQSKFVDSLQRKYDQLDSTKSMARGVGKYTNDLINSITGARNLSMQLVDKIISAKKTMADLEFKERKEFGKDNNSDQQNMSNYASTYLKTMMTAGRNNIVDSQNQGYENFNNINEDDDDYNDLFSSIEENLGDSDRSEETEKYLKYEKQNVQVKVLWYDDKDEDADDKYEFIAYNENGDIIEDYPLPFKTKLSINRTTATAIDIYGNKYELLVINSV